ncbi:Radical SAM heme biosynthesis protein AhbC, 12,18-didecarboxysirohaem deacetylase [hydrothermal vent metagenome]|uniref:Radical SAM heme biosynthesis protein AhbC, 12,18-didecarboxysirohaem deacetylase n=1 Tax=hydrothermal vent metagenome TaxID=652676 RepID=A0A3B1BYX5_9ZZZZ
MFRLSSYIKMLKSVTPANGASCHTKQNARKKSPIVIWNLTRYCNLECVHCYSSSKARNFNNELSTEQTFKVVGDLKRAGVPALILSGGEPLLRDDTLDIAKRAREVGIITSLSTNGTQIDEQMADRVAEADFSYVGISLDGMEEIHDRFRGLKGSFKLAVDGLRRCKERGLKAGTRFTLTKLNIEDLPAIFDFAESEKVDKLYLSHLVYSGRGQANSAEDLEPAETREVMDYVINKAIYYVENEIPIQIVTGNNDTDGVLLYLHMKEKNPEAAKRLLPMLKRAGGNSAGIGISNIDPVGDVHPDPLTSSITLGNVAKQSFGDIWFNSNNPVLRRLRQLPRTLNGRCGDCTWISVCGGNARVRAQRDTGDFWGSDPACYLSDEEIQVKMAYAI